MKTLNKVLLSLLVVLCTSLFAQEEMSREDMVAKGASGGNIACEFYFKKLKGNLNKLDDIELFSERLQLEVVRTIESDMINIVKVCPTDSLIYETVIERLRIMRSK